MIFDLDEKGNRALVEEAKANPLTLDAVKPTAFTGAAQGLGFGAMRGGARLMQGFGLALSTVPIALDKIAPEQGSDTARQDRMFQWIDELPGRAVDYWTPSATEVGTVGRVLGGLAEIAPALAASGGNPMVAGPLIAGQQTAGVGIDLAKQGVSGPAAGAAAAAQGVGAAAGFAIPFFGNTLASRIASGVAGNLVTNAGSAALSQAELKKQGFSKQAEQFNPADPEARIVDVLTGIAFGGFAHLTAPRPLVKPSHVDAALTGLNAKNFQQDSAPGRPADAGSSAIHQQSMETAIEQMARGEPVNVGERATQAGFVPGSRAAVSYPLPDEAGPVARPVPPPRVTALQATAARLGVNPQDLAAVISYETAGTMSPSIMGGTGGRYMGLIQFGPAERAKYGAHAGQSFEEQLGAVERYLKDRGLPQGADLATIYRTVNGGNPRAGLNLSDGNGTIAQHIARIQKEHLPKVSDFALNAPDSANTVALQRPALTTETRAVADTGGAVLPVDIPAPDAVAREPVRPAESVAESLPTEIKFTDWQDIGGGFSVRQSTTHPMQDIRTPDGNVITRGTDSTGKTYMEFESSRNPLEKGGMAWIDQAKRDIEIMRIPPVPSVDRSTNLIARDRTVQPGPVAQGTPLETVSKTAGNASARVTDAGEAKGQLQAPPPTPEVEAAKVAAERRPDMRVQLEDGTELTAREAMALMADDHATAANDAQAFIAAANCFLRTL